jgi:predicted lipoprotein
MKRLLPWIVVLMLGAGLCRVLPPFRVHSLKAAREAQAAGHFNAADFVRAFWGDRLLPAADRATDASRVLEAISAGPAKVREQFGRTVGASSSYFLFVRGSGRVVSTNDDNIGLAVRPGSDTAEVVVPLGLVFGNAVRDGTGLLDSGSFPNAQEFNDISAALNSLVETNVLPQLQQIARVGGRIRFAGCAEVADEETDLKPLKLVPVLVKLE